MRKVAVSRVIRIPEAESWVRQTVTINANGVYLSHTSLKEETERTEWLPGIIILSPITVERLLGEDFHAMIVRLCKSVKLTTAPIYRAFWISPFDTVNLRFLSSSCVRILSSPPKFSTNHSGSYGHV